MSSNKGLSFGQFIIILLSVAVGFFLGIYSYTHKPNQRVLFAGKNKIETILDIISQQYVDTINMNQLLEKTSASIVKELDPHSVLIPAESLQAINEDLEGSFSGIGVTFTMSNDTILITNISIHGPAEKAGLLAFDRIITINDSTYSGSRINQEEIKRNLRGAKGSKVKLGIQRSHAPELIYFDVERGDVPNYSIEAAFALENNIGYIKVKNFARTTYNEFITAIARLKSEGCNGFIVDLRGNSGGYMESAVRMLNEFLPANSVIVNTKGQAFKQNFSADGSGSCQNTPIVVLTDEASGSASEIFAGAIQDNDRGLIIGRRTYGKGVVQAPIPLKDGSELRLTIARYYTPSGRCIQKMYELGKSDEYDMDLYNRYQHGEFYSADSIHVIDSLAYTTVGGRTVYGGGGIMPDIFIPQDTSHITSYYLNVMNSGVLHQFTLEYSERNYDKLASYKANYKDLYAYLKQQPLLSDLVDYADAQGIKKRPTLIQISRNLIENSLYASIVQNFFRDGFYPILFQDDATMHRALQVIQDGTWHPASTV